MASSDVLTPPLHDQDSSQQSIKRRAACEECRTKKLKCSGTQPACVRCVREGIPCYYSPQKTMGRPKKRARTGEHPELDGSNTTSRSNGADSNSQVWDAPITDPSAIPQEQEGNTAYDMGSYASAFNPDGSLQPWLNQNSPGDLANSWHSPNSNAVPALTPDNDSLSPAGGSASFSAGFHLDPSLNVPPTTTAAPFSASCACLSTMYLTLEKLNNMKNSSSLTFPAALHPLREAMSTAKTIICCEECPRHFITGVQNTQLLGALFIAIAERFSRVLENINEEAARAENEGERKRFRLTDLNGENGGHLHLGGAGCMAAFSLDLSPGEWRSMCKKVVRAEVVGPAEGGEGDCPGSDEHSHCPYFLGLTKQMEERQHRWHKMPLPEDFPKGAMGMFPHGRDGGKKEEPLCLKLVGSSRTLVGSFDWS